MRLPLFRPKVPSASPQREALPLPDPAEPPGAVARLHIERLEGLDLIGWACTAAGEVAVPELAVDGQPCPVDVRAVHRQDVLDALALDTAAPLGFRLQLPPTVWDADGRATRMVTLRAGAAEAVVPLPRDLDSALLAWREHADGGFPLADTVAHASAHARQFAGAIAPATAQWLAEQVARIGGEDTLRQISRLSSACWHGRVERMESGILHGWAWVEGADAETITLLADAEPLECSVIRVERNDVQATLGADRRRLGFEIEVPATAWTSDCVTLSVLASGRPLPSERPLELTKPLLVAWLEQQRHAELQVPAQESPSARQERQYRSLLLLEHAAAARVMDALSAPQQAFLRATAERFGVSALLSAPGDGRTPTLGDVEAADFATQANWRLMRAFNEALAVHDEPLAALNAVIAHHQPGAEAAQRFYWSVLPYFCGRHLYAQLRPRLDGARLRALGGSSSAYDLTLLLPEAVSSGDLHLATAAMKALCDAKSGWLNTECVGEAVRMVVEQGGVRTLQRPQATDLLNAFLSFIEALGDAGYWSRLHDAHLIGALVRLLSATDGLPPGLSAWTVEVAVRRFALVPDFWRQLASAPPPASGWGERIEEAQAAFLVVERCLAGRDDADHWGALTKLARLKSDGNRDAEVVARELLMSGAHAAQLSAAALLVMGRSDQLRLAAHPIARGPDFPPPAAQVIRTLSGIPEVPARAALASMAPRCLGADAGGSAQSVDAEALLPLSGSDNHHVGVRLLASAWRRRHGASAETPASHAMLVELRDRWFAAFDHCVHLPHPPAALSATLSLLAAAPSAERGALQQLTAEMRRAMRRRYGPEAALSESASVCASQRLPHGDEGHATLVAIYSCVRNLPTRVQAIRETWAKELTARGIPWVVVVGDGDGVLDADVLRLDAPDDYESLPAKTLALIDWVYRNTRFEHLVKIDDDCHLAVNAYFDEVPYLGHHYHGRLLHRPIGATDRVWHQGKSKSRRAAGAADKTPEPSTYADGSSAYALSRHAMAQLALALESTVGARLTRSAFLEDKLLGDLLATRGLGVSNEGHYTLIRRRFGPGASPVNAWDNLFYPSAVSPTLVTHLDDHLPMARVEAGLRGAELWPARIWPTDRSVQISGHQTNQLELLSEVGRVALLRQAPFLVIAVARNERVLLPHFLAHYRRLGATSFVFVDNLSDDGTREYLLDQPDVVLYSADTEYKESHYGVSWQQAVLGAHAVGKWVVLADLDEFLVYPACESRPLADWLSSLEAAGHDACQVRMIDMYPAGLLDEADFATRAPFEAATHFDDQPLIRWRLGSGSFSNSETYLSGLRHRVIPDSAPNIYTAQKMAVLKYQPWVRFAEGLHYASNLRAAPAPAWFAHFKYHAGFRRKVLTEVARKQHFNGAEEYRKYAGMLAESRDTLAEPGLTREYAGSATWQRDA